MVETVIVEADFTECGNAAVGFARCGESVELSEVVRGAGGVFVEYFYAAGMDTDGGENVAGCSGVADVLERIAYWIGGRTVFFSDQEGFLALFQV